MDLTTIQIRKTSLKKLRKHELAKRETNADILDRILTTKEDRL